MKELKFFLTETEESNLEKFYENHCNCPFTSAVGGKYTFTITPTGFGPCISIKCNCCDKEVEITDLESW